MAGESPYSKGAPLDRALRAALRDASDCPGLPRGFSQRVVELTESMEAADARRVWKIAASLAVCCSFAAFATLTAVSPSRRGEAPPQEHEVAPVPEVVVADEPLETCQEEPCEADVADEETPPGASVTDAGGVVAAVPAGEGGTNVDHETGKDAKGDDGDMKRVGRAAALAASAMLATAPAGAGASEPQVKSGVFDDVRAWYRGARKADDQTSNTPYGSTGNNTSCHTFKSIPHNYEPTNSFNALKWNWYGCHTVLAGEPVVCPYANCVISNVTYCHRPVPVATNGWADVTVGGVTTSQPVLKHPKGPDYLKTGDWLANHESKSVVSNWTLVARLRVDEPVNNIAGGSSGYGDAVFVHNRDYSARKGVTVSFTVDRTLGTCRMPRFWCGRTFVTLADALIPHGNWVDLAVAVNGTNVVFAACVQGTNDVVSLHWNKLVFPEDSPALVAGGDTFALFSPKCSGGWQGEWTNGVKSTTQYSGSNNDSGQRTQMFRGAMHQLAFWDRTLAPEEIREAWGVGRPNLVHIGMEGNGTNEFRAVTSAVANAGAWDSLDPVLTTNNTSIEVSFDCPKLWAALPQYMRLVAAKDSCAGSAGVYLNGVQAGNISFSPGKPTRLYIQKDKIVEGRNTLVLSLARGSGLALDSLQVGGSWRFGESTDSFSYSDGNLYADSYVYNPACGVDKLHIRTMKNWDDEETVFDFFLAGDLVELSHGAVFATEINYSGDNVIPFEFYMNGNLLGTWTFQSGSYSEVKVPPSALKAGWNHASWKRAGSGWANQSFHMFTVKPLRVPMMMMYVR